MPPPPGSSQSQASGPDPTLLDMALAKLKYLFTPGIDTRPAPPPEHPTIGAWRPPTDVPQDPTHPHVGAAPHEIDPLDWLPDALQAGIRPITDRIEEARNRVASIPALDWLQTGAGLMGAMAPRPYLPEGMVEPPPQPPWERTAEGRLLVSPAVPSAIKDPLPDPPGKLIEAGLDRAKLDPKFYGKLATEARRFPGLTEAQRAMNDQGAVDAARDLATQNYGRLIDWEPSEVQARSGQWYHGARKINDEIAAGSKRETISPDAATALTATQSPTKEWPQNIELSRRIARDWADYAHSDPIFTPRMADLLEAQMTKSGENWIKSKKLTGQALADFQAHTAERIARARQYQGTRWNSLPLEQQAQMLRIANVLSGEPQEFHLYSPEGDIIGPALTNPKEGSKTPPRPRKLVWQSYPILESGLSVLYDQSPENISYQLGEGQKVRSFNNSMADPTDPRSPVIDTHKVAGGQMRPLGSSSKPVKQVMGGPGSARTGLSGTGSIYRDAIRDASVQRNLVPSAGQAIGWEGIKGLFKPWQRTSKPFRTSIDEVWNDFSQGKISLRDAQDEIYQLSGGVDPPEWLGK